MMGRNAERQVDLAQIESLLPSLHVEDRAARLALRHAQLALDTDRFAEARNFAEKAVELALSAKAVGLAVTAYRMLSTALLKHAKLDQAAEQGNRGLDLARQTSSRREESRLLNSLGLISIEQGNYPAAQTYFEQSLMITQEEGNLLDQPLPLNNLGMVLGILGDYSGARGFYEQSLVLARKIGYRSGEGLVLGNLGWVSGMMGEYTQARSYAEQNLRIAREVGAASNEAYCLINLSAFAGNMGDYPAAEQYAEQGCALARHIGDRSAEAWSLTYLGHSLLAQARLAEADAAYQAALDLRTQLGQAVLATEPAAGLARIALAGGDQQTAQKYLEIILPHLLTSSLQRTDEPIRVFLTGYLVLYAAKDPRAAEILETAYHLLQTRAASIPDENTRRSFLANIPHHAELLAAWSNRSI
jgi:tetratricopeptide (TPR) repeat protein